MNPLAGIRIKIAIKQEIYKHTPTQKNNNVQNSSFFSVCFCTCIFHKKVTIDERKSKKHLKNKSMTKIL